MIKPIKFASTLTQLIEGHRNARTRKKICGDLSLSPSLLSQYELGKSVPSFGKLVKLAAYFDVSLDFLVFGESDRGTSTKQPIVDATYRFIDEKLEVLSAQSEKRHWFLSKLANIIVTRMDRSIDRVVESGRGDVTDLGFPGFLDDQSVFQLESYARTVSIFTTDFSYDVIVNERGEVVPGKFFPIVAENIRDRGCKYRFLLPKGRDWQIHISGFLDLLRDAVGEHVAESCECVVADRTLISGLAICELNVETLEREAPILHAQVEDHISGNAVAYIIPPTTLVHGDLLVARNYVPSAITLFEEAWTAGKLASKRKRGSPTHRDS